MKDRAINREEAIQIARDLGKQLPQLVKQKSVSGRTEWTKAIWCFFKKMQEDYPTWILYPSGEPIKGRVAGEYMVDFCLYDPQRGIRIACESEWGDIGRIDWGFDKLRSIKADLKILIFQASHSPIDGVDEAKDIFARIESYLCSSHHHHRDREFYLFLQWDHDQVKLFRWEPEHEGPFKAGEVKLIDFTT